jgi:hypothetical protein
MQDDVTAHTNYSINAVNRVFENRLRSYTQIVSCKVSSLKFLSPLYCAHLWDLPCTKFTVTEVGIHDGKGRAMGNV